MEHFFQISTDQLMFNSLLQTGEYYTNVIVTNAINNFKCLFMIISNCFKICICKYLPQQVDELLKRVEMLLQINKVYMVFLISIV